MPPGAVSSRPGLAAAAPVNAPRSWPNSSLSSSVSDSAAQLMADQRPIGARRPAVDGPRQDLLADPGLAQDQHRDVGAGGAGGERLDAAHAAVRNVAGRALLAAGAGRRAREQRRGVRPVGRIARDAGANRVRPGEATDESRRRVARQPGEQDRLLPGTVVPDDVDRNAAPRRPWRRRRRAHTPAKTRRPIASARARSHSIRDSSSARASGGRARRGSIEIDHQQQRADPDRLARVDLARVSAGPSRRSSTYVPLALPSSSISTSPLARRRGSARAGATPSRRGGGRPRPRHVRPPACCPPAADSCQTRRCRSPAAAARLGPPARLRLPSSSVLGVGIRPARFSSGTPFGSGAS